MYWAGCDIDIGDTVYEPPRSGPTLWEIGIPDRSAAEFYVPDPNPKYINKLYVNHPDRLAQTPLYLWTLRNHLYRVNTPVFSFPYNCRFRQYGLWERYADLYPEEDLVFTVGVSDYTRDWFFAHVTRSSSSDFVVTMSKFHLLYLKVLVSVDKLVTFMALTYFKMFWETGRRMMASIKALRGK